MKTPEEYTEQYFEDDKLPLVDMIGEIQQDAIRSFISWHNDRNSVVNAEKYIPSSEIGKFNLRK